MSLKQQEKTKETAPVQDSIKTIEKNELDYWLMSNMELMEKLSVIQPACWCEADGSKE